MRSALVTSAVGLVLCVACSHAAPPPHDQMPLSSTSVSQASGRNGVNAMKKRPLKGRFLHLTDIHPDKHYKGGATLQSGCHEKPSKKKKKGRKDKAKGTVTNDEPWELNEEDDLAGKWGTPVSDCDCPMSLVNITFDWLKEEWANEIDFVVWTGDNARHDIDRSIPRTPKEISSSNRMVVDKMLDTFGRDMPIVPSIGNNDIYPHNVLAAGPNKITEEFLHIWKRFIPAEASHVFERGAYYSSEVIPDRLAVISLNTLFWYDSNTLVDGCGDHSNDPGALEMDWLEVQLNNFRQRGMQVWMTGHVPPHMGHYYDNCYLRYGDLALRFQDTILGHLFGHMNIDHFFFIDVDELESTSSFSPLNATLHPSRESRNSFSSSPFGPIRTAGRSGAKNLEADLKKDFGEMPGPRVLALKDYAVMNVAPSVIPTYYPGIRIFSYNISGLDEDSLGDDVFYIGGDEPEDEETQDEEVVEEEYETGIFGVIDTREQADVEISKRRGGGHKHENRPKDDCSLPENEDKPHCVFKRKPRHTSKKSPSRKNRALSPLGYTQFYLPSMMKQKKRPEWEVEYSTHKIKDLAPHSLDNQSQPLPVPLHLLPSYDPAIFSEKPTDKSAKKQIAKKKAKFYKALKKVTPYRMKDLTIGSWIKLARMLVLEKKRWKTFSELMLVSTEKNED